MTNANIGDLSMMHKLKFHCNTVNHTIN